MLITVSMTSPRLALSNALDLATVSLVVVSLTSGCTFDGASLPVPLEGLNTVEFTADISGVLVRCETGKPCQTIANPEGCARYLVSADSAGEVVCERCEDANGDLIRDTCSRDELKVQCTLVKAPDPDCLVCSSVDGPVILSTCSSSGPIDCIYYDDGIPFRAQADPAGCLSDAECGAGEVCAPADAGSFWGTCVPNCQVCLDTNGRSVLSECPGDCAEVACPEVICGPGFTPLRRPGECCDSCIPISDCRNAVCAVDVTVPECPSGTVLERDPTDCCLLVCVPTSCMGTVADESAVSCPQGYRWDTDFPSCGRCVLIAGTQCSSDGDCPPDAFCAIDPLTCEPCPSGTHCPSECLGVCRPNEPVSCEAPLALPSAQCDGFWESPGTGPDGCPLPPVCMCADGVTSFSGTCSDQCDLVQCSTAVTECDPGYTLVDDYPYCCGTCVPDDTTCTDPNGSMVVCSEIQCSEGSHLEPDPNGCCDVCVADESACVDSTTCGLGRVCSVEFGECEETSDPACTTTVCPTVCGGYCVPENTCMDTDGLDFSDRGSVQGRRFNDRFVLEDFCESPTALIEYWCFSDPASGAGSEAGIVRVQCEHGCAEGKCLSGDTSTSP